MTSWRRLGSTGMRIMTRMSSARYPCGLETMERDFEMHGLLVKDIGSSESSRSTFRYVLFLFSI
jgi:uncharacterized protein YkuJ